MIQAAQCSPIYICSCQMASRAAASTLQILWMILSTAFASWRSELLFKRLLIMGRGMYSLVQTMLLRVVNLMLLIPIRSSMQSLPYTTSNSTVVYAIDATNLAVAVIIGLLAPIAALPLFWGWWRLGRKVSMSPLEIASSFYAGPRGGGAGVVFGRFGGNEEAVQLLKELGGARGEGHVRVVYGNLPQSDRLGLRLVSRTEE